MPREFWFAHGTVGPPVVITSEQNEVGANLPSVMEVISEIGFNERCKAAGPKALSPFFFKNRDEVLTSQLAKLMGSIRMRKGIPKDQSKSVSVPI